MRGTLLEGEGERMWVGEQSLPVHLSVHWHRPCQVDDILSPPQALCKPPKEPPPLLLACPPSRRRSIEPERLPPRRPEEQAEFLTHENLLDGMDTGECTCTCTCMDTDT